MNIATRIRLYTALTLLAALGGIYLVTTQGPALTTVGVMLVISSAILFLADVKDLLVRNDRARTGESTS